MVSSQARLLRPGLVLSGCSVLVITTSASKLYIRLWRGERKLTNEQVLFQALPSQELGRYHEELTKLTGMLHTCQGKPDELRLSTCVLRQNDKALAYRHTHRGP